MACAISVVHILKIFVIVWLNVKKLWTHNETWLISVAYGNVALDKKTISILLGNDEMDYAVNTVIFIAKFYIHRGRWKVKVPTIHMIKMR